MFMKAAGTMMLWRCDWHNSCQPDRQNHNWRNHVSKRKDEGSQEWDRGNEYKPGSGSKGKSVLLCFCRENNLPVNKLRHEQEWSFCHRATFVSTPSLPPAIASKAHNPFQDTLDQHPSPPGSCLHDLSLVIPSQSQITPHPLSCPLPKMPHTFCASVTIWGARSIPVGLRQTSVQHIMSWVGGLAYFVRTHTHTLMGWTGGWEKEAVWVT